MGMLGQVWTCIGMHVVVLNTMSYVMYIAPRLYNGVHVRSYSHPPFLIQQFKLFYTTAPSFKFNFYNNGM